MFFFFNWKVEFYLHLRLKMMKTFLSAAYSYYTYYAFLKTYTRVWMWFMSLNVQKDLLRWIDRTCLIIRQTLHKYKRNGDDKWLLFFFWENDQYLDFFPSFLASHFYCFCFWTFITCNFLPDRQYTNVSGFFFLWRR